MLVRWVAFCHETSVPVVQERMLSVIDRMNPGTAPQSWVSRRWNDPEIFRITYEFYASGIPENLAELAAYIGGNDNTFVIDQGNYLDVSARISREEIKNSPGKANAICSVYKLFEQGEN